ncbi:hypothetical protein ACLK17_13760 [Escherichia coli]
MIELIVMRRRLQKRKLRGRLTRGSWERCPRCSNVLATMLRVRNGWSQSSACVMVCTT